MNGPRTLLISVVVLLAACGDADRQSGRERASAQTSASALVVASNYPLYFFASRIADGVDVAPEIVFPDIEGDPASWVPSAEQIQNLQSADLVILNGAGAESWLNLISIDRRRLVDTTADIDDRLIALGDSVLHQHGPAGEHSHEGTAFTTWLDPQLAIAQAESVTNALIELTPSGEVGFRDNLATLQKELMGIDERLVEVFARLDDRPVLFSHPVYQYLQRRFEINSQSVHWEPDEEPSTSDWIELQQKLPSHRATLMIWEDEPLASTVLRLSDVDIRSVVFLTMGTRSDEGDYISVMTENADRIATELERLAP